MTNTAKIRVRKDAIRKADLGALMRRDDDEARAEVANLRLEAIASLPHLAVFSDPAHHTCGRSLNAGLEKVRKTVDCLAEKTEVRVTVNTTGTPWFRKQPLRDVVVRYGLSQGIGDDILKDVSGNIRPLELEDDRSAFGDPVIRDFFRDHGDVVLPSGAPAKLAMYFPQTDDPEALRPTVELALARAELSPAVALRNTSDSSKDEIDALNRLNDPAAPHRVILLENEGTEPGTARASPRARLSGSSGPATTSCSRRPPGHARRLRRRGSLEGSPTPRRPTSSSSSAAGTGAGAATHPISPALR